MIRKAKRRTVRKSRASRARPSAKARAARKPRKAAGARRVPRAARAQKARKARAPARGAARAPRQAAPPPPAEGKVDFASLSLKDALDLAILVEEEAKERYQEFSRIVGGRYPGDASDVFTRMASYEARHGEELAARRRDLFPGAPRTVERSMLDDVEAPDRGQPRVFMSARQAFDVALASEEKARDFFAGALRYVQDPEVRRLFEELEAEEVQHRDLIRKAMEGLPEGPDVEESEADEPGSDAG